MIIYMNQNNNNMKLQLNNSEVSQLKNLIFEKIDEVGGIDILSPELHNVLVKLSTPVKPK
jgi:hypothetical protein